MPDDRSGTDRPGITKLKQYTLATDPIGHSVLIFIEALLIDRVLHGRDATSETWKLPLQIITP